MVNVFPGEPPRADQVAAELSLTAARREHESAQIVVSAGPEPLSVERVEVTDLRQTNGTATIAADQVAVRLVGYTEVERPSWRGVKRLGLWPDPLLRFRPFVCPAGQARSLWVSVHVPEKATAGDYVGTIPLFSDTETITAVPVRLRVSDFTLPEAPRLHTSYWSCFSGSYDPQPEEPILERMIRMFGAYRVSTSVAQPGDVTWYREADGTITAEWARMRRRLELAAASGFRTLNIGPGVQGVHGDATILRGTVYDQETGRPLDAAAAPENTSEARARAYLVPLADWLQGQGRLGRAYMQILDEDVHQANWPRVFLPRVELFRGVEPRIALATVLGCHPIHQGWFDIAAPHLSFYDADTYRMLREGISLRGPKRFAAKVTASSTGGWGNAGFYTYEPYDAYDGCAYTKWIPKVAPTADEPQWLRFDFDQPAAIDGLRLLPYGELDEEVAWTCEGSTDGETFGPLRLTPRGDEQNAWSFEGGPYRAIRLVWTKGRRAFVATEDQPLPAPEPMTVGGREVEFLKKGLPREATLPRERVRPVKMMWEYQVGANYPSVCIDADPAEIRATAWQCWVRGVDGYLNYGGAQWAYIGYDERPRTRDPLVWPAHHHGGGNGGGMIVYPGKDEVLPSIRLARFRDGVDDCDYLTLLAETRSNHPLAAELRRLGRAAYRSGPVIETNRRALIEAIEEQR